MALTKPRHGQLQTNTAKFDDQLIELQASASGANINDIGILFNQGTSGDRLGIIWDQSASTFALVTTSSDSDASGDITVTAYSDLQVNSITTAGFALPSADGTDGQILITDGLGSVTWNDPPASGVWTETANNTLYAGTGAGASLTTGANNFLGGVNAGDSVTDGNGNILLGANAGAALVSEDYSVMIGTSAGQNSSGAGEIVAVGYQAGQNSTALYNAFVGGNAGRYVSSGTFTTAIGYGAMNGVAGNLVTGTSNTAVGTNALNVIRTTAQRNTAVGASALGINSTGRYNTAIGQAAGIAITTGENNICIGRSAGPTANGSNGLYIDVTQTNTPLIHGNFSTGDVTINGNLSVTGTFPSSGIANVVEDTTPQLGGNLDTNGNDINVASASQIFLPDGTVSNPAIAFTSDVDTGIYLSAGSINFAHAGGQRLVINSAGVTAIDKLYGPSSGTVSAPAISFNGWSNTGLWPYFAATNKLGFTVGGVQQLEMVQTGALNVAAKTNYETLVTSDDDIPNKKYVDDAISTAAFGHLSNVVEDTTPQLGGDLDVNGSNIVGAPAATATSNGGNVNLIAAAGGATSGNGGNVTLTAGTATNGVGGSIGLTARPATATGGTGGSVTVNSGQGGPTSGQGGPITFNAGAGQGTGTGGSINFNAGSAASNGGGAINLTSGDSSNSASGNIKLETGTALNNGGDIDLALGAGTVTGDVLIRSKHAASNFVPSLRFHEATNNGTNYVGIRSPASVTTTRDWILPQDDPSGFGAGGTYFLTSDNTGTLSFAAAGTADPLLLSNGSVSAPTYSFTSSTNTGLYYQSGSLRFAYGGANPLYVTSNSVNPTGQVRSDLSGSTSTPNYTFTGDTNTGIYSSGTGFIHHSASGSAVFDTSPTYNYSRVNHRFPSGSAASPSITHGTDTNTGIYFDGSDAIYISTNSTQRLAIEADGTLNVSGTTNYETLVTADDDIPNKKYVDEIVQDTAMLMSIVYGI